MHLPTTLVQINDLLFMPRNEKLVAEIKIEGRSRSTIRERTRRGLD